MRSLRLLSRPGIVDLELDRDGVKAPCHIIGTFGSLELLEAIFSGVSFTAHVESRDGCAILQTSSIALLKPFSSYVKTEGAGSMVSGRIIGISALAKSKKTPPTWCIRVEVLNEAQQSIKLSVVMQGLLKYRYLFRHDGRVTIHRLQRVMVDENVGAYLAIDGASVVSSYRHPPQTEALRLRVLKISGTVLVCETDDESRLTLEISDWAHGQMDIIGVGAQIAVSDYFVLGSGNLSLCRHGHLIVDYLCRTFTCAGSLKNVPGCPAHRAHLGWEELKGVEDSTESCLINSISSRGWTSLVNECLCFHGLCDIPIRSPPLILLAKFTGVLETALEGVLTPECYLADKSIPSGLTLITHGVPDIGTFKASNHVLIEKPTMQKGAVFIPSLEVEPLRAAETLGLVTRVDQRMRRTQFVTMNASGAAVTCEMILTTRLLFQLEPLCWIGISEQRTIRRVASPQRDAGGLSNIVLKAASQVIQCRSVTETRRCKPGSVLYLPRLILIEARVCTDFANIPSVYAMRAPAHKMTAAFLDDPTRQTFTLLISGSALGDISFPVICDLYEVGWLASSEDVGVLLSSGRISLHYIGVPREVLINSVDLTGYLISIDCIQASLICSGCSNATHASMPCSCGWPICGVKLSIKATFSFQSSQQIIHRFEAVDKVGDALLTFCQPSVAADLLDRLGKRTAVVKLESGVHLSPPALVSLTVIQGSQIQHLQPISIAAWIRKRLG